MVSPSPKSTVYNEDYFLLYEQYLIQKSREDFWVFRQYLNPKMKLGWWQKETARALMQFYQDLIDGKSPWLLIEAPPQNGKSTQVVEFLAWLAGKRPDLKKIYTSYSERLGVRANRTMQRIMDSPKYQAVFPDTKLNSKNVVTVAGQYQRNMEILEYVGQTGFFRNTTIGGAITGESLDCLTKGSLVETNIGQIPIEKFETIDSPVKVLSYSKKGFTYEKVKAFAITRSNGIYRVTTESGRILESSSNHRYFTIESGYTPASLLSTGQTILSSLQERIYETSFGDSEMGTCSWRQSILFSKLFSFIFGSKQKNIFRLPNLRSKDWEPYKSILQALFNCCEKGKQFQKIWQSFKIYKLPSMPKRIFCPFYGSGETKTILFKRMCRQGTLKKNVREKKSKLFLGSKPIEKTVAFSKSIQAHETKSHSKRFWDLCRLWMFGKKNGSSSYRSESYEQLFREFGSTLQSLPSRNSQLHAEGWRIVREKIVSIQYINKEAVTYDIQIENTHNFFANGILVHNCGIIDDALKGREQAESETIRNKVWDWFTDDFLTRFSEGGALLGIGTRWHVDDPFGRIKEKYPQAKFLTFKAIAEEDEPPFRKKGEALFPEHKSIEYLEKMKSVLDVTSWESLFQQNPITKTGNWFPNPQRISWSDQNFISVYAWLDPAFKGDNRTALGLIGKTRDGKTVAKGFTWRKPVTDLYPEIIQHLKDNKVGTLFVETNADQERSKEDLAKLWPSVQGRRSTLNKHIKILTRLVQYWNEIFIADDCSQEFLLRIMRYKEGIDDDEADTLASLLDELGMGKNPLLERFGLQ